MTPIPTLQSHNDTAAAADNDTKRMPVLHGNADSRKRQADQPVSYDPSPAGGPLARMLTDASNVKIDYAQYELHVREMKKSLSDGAFTCPVCKKVFAGHTLENATKHLLRHLDDRSLCPYKCAHDGCDYTAITEGEVEHHVTAEHQAVWTEDVKRQCTHAENKARLDALCEEVKLMLRRGLLMLPSENVLDVLQCVDFPSLLALQRSGSPFYDVVHRNLSVLPRLRVFELYVDLAVVRPARLREIVGDTRDVVLTSPEDTSVQVPYTEEYDYSMLQPFAAAVGTNFINCAIIASSLGETHAMKWDMRKAVEALPALKHVRELIFELGCMMHTSYDVDMLFERLILSPLDNLQCLELSEMNNRTDWTFLRKDWALRLRSLSVDAHIDARGQAEILEYCTDFVHLPKGKSKKLRITGGPISPEFLQRIVTTVAECEDWLTVVVDGALGFLENDADYAHADVPLKNPLSARDFCSVRYSCLDGSHRVFVFGLKRPLGPAKPTIAVANNPFITTWNDACVLDFEDF